MKYERKYEDDNIENCLVASVQKIIRRKWAMVIIFFLSQGTLRFGELSRKMPQVTQANLTKELRMLEEYRIIHREIYKEIPPKVEYSLTELGVRLGIIASNFKERLKWFY